MSKNPPIETIHVGNIEIAVWESYGEDQKVFYNVTAKRNYMDQNGAWKDAGTVHLLPQQLPDLVLGLQKAHEFLRIGIRQRRRQQVLNPDQTLPPPPKEDQRPRPSTEQSEQAAVNEEQSHVDRLSQSRSGKRSR